MSRKLELIRESKLYRLLPGKTDKSRLEASGVDLLYGAGGAPESVITASAIRSLGGGFKAQVVDAECKVRGPVVDQTELVTGPCSFAATGITNGSLLDGVRFTSKGPVTNSVFMRSASGTVRWLTTHHGNR